MRNAVKKRKRLVILSVTLFMICGMALGYAALSSSIKINGTGTISTSWDILFTNITEKSSRGAVNNDSRITDKLTATFDVDLESPGSYIEYNVTIKNNGNMDALIAKITGIVEANDQEPTGIQFKVSGIRPGDQLLAGSGKTFVVRAEIPSSVGKLPETSKTLELTVEVRQKEVDSSGLVTTLSECFQTNETGETITGYLCGKGNANGYSEILDVNIPSELNGHTITKIGSSAFYLKGLNSVHIGSNIIGIDDNAFSRNNLRELHIPNSVKTIGDRAFETNSITSLELSNGVTMIGNQAFRSNQLKTLILPNSVKTIDVEAFASNQLTELEIPSSVTRIGSGAFRGNQMPDEKAFIYNRNNDGTEDRAILNSYAGAKRSDVVIPSGVEIIEVYAFRGIGLKSVILPEGLKRIQMLTFTDNDLTEITIPASVTALSSGFTNNKNLSSVTFMGNVPVLERPGIFANTGLGRSNTIKVLIGTLAQYKNISSQTWFGSDNESLLDAFYES